MRYAVLLMMLIVIGGCNNTTDTRIPLYTIHVDTVRGLGRVSEGDFDSTMAYTYRTQEVSMDSLIRSLLSNHPVVAGYFSLSYLCMDPRGPRPVILTYKPDTSLLKLGFTQGANGRFGCSDTVARYQVIN